MASTAPRRTKIVATLGPASATQERVTALARAGMDGARLNFSHGTHEQHAATIASVREVARELEVVRVLAGQRRDRHRNAGDVDALVRRDRPADDDGAAGLAGRDLLDAEPNEPVVDEDVVARLENLADHRGKYRKLPRPGAVAGDGDLLALLEPHRAADVADPELGALQVGDERDRAPHLLLRLPHHPCVLGVLLVRPVREVQARTVHSGARERGDALLRRRGRA